MILMKSRLELAKEDMQMLTGVVSDDFEYLVYLLVKEGLKEKKKVDKVIIPYNVSEVKPLDKWFHSLEDVQIGE